MFGADLGGEVTSVGPPGAVTTLVNGGSFCRSLASGDITSTLAQGLFVLDTRVLSRWQLTVNGDPVEGLAVDEDEAHRATFVGRARPAPGRADAELVVFRHRVVDRGMCEQIRIQHFGPEPVEVVVVLELDADFAGIFEVKAGQVHPPEGERSVRLSSTRLDLGLRAGRLRREVHVSVSQPARVEAGELRWQLTLQPRQEWEVFCDVSLSFQDLRVGPDPTCAPRRPRVDQPTGPERGLGLAAACSTPDLEAVLERSVEDLGSLRVYDPDHPDDPIVAAGAPWYMALFGRDSLITSWMVLPFDPALALGVLRTLARHQGVEVVPDTDEEPGRILHEVRLNLIDGISLDHGQISYGSIDATALFVMLLGELYRWGCDLAELEPLVAHADRAITWIEVYGDRDGDGLVEYERRSERGLANQGWKDSFDGIRYADGGFPTTPIALCEVQGYVWAAYRARAELARALGDEHTAERCEHRAAELRRRFHEHFWLDERGWFALALDADKRPVDALASNMGHCLWSGIVEAELAPRVAQQLCAPEMFSGWGVRTLATSMAAYNPISYHNGSVWPHDNALAVAGLARYGLLDEAHRIIRAQLDVARHTAFRLPELFAGFDRRELARPAPYPSSCSPQAWAAAAPLVWLRVLLGVDADLPAGRFQVDPQLPEWLEWVRIEGLTVGGREVRVVADRRSCSVDGAPVAVSRGR